MTKKKLTLGLVAALSSALVFMPGTAHAADVYLSSTSGKTSVIYDDGANRFYTCDNVPGDGIGGYAYVSMGFDMTVYNGCEAWRGTIPDNVWTTIQVCDWVSVNGQRVGRNCSYKAGFWS